MAASSDVRLEVDDPPRHLAVPGDRRDLVSAVEQPGRQRHQVLRAGFARPGRGSVPTEPDAVEIAVIDQGVGHPGPGPGAHLRALLPGRPGPVPADRGHRAGPVDRPPRGRQPLGVGAGGVPGGGGVDVHPAPAGPRLAAGPAGPPESSSGERPPEEATVPEPLTVLVIEDEESFIEALVVGLKREGFLVTVARDGIEGLAMFDRVRPDLVLLDIWLPHKSGIDVCRELRTRTRVPIIMVTAKSSEIDTVVGLEVGADDYVTKPYRLAGAGRPHARRAAALAGRRRRGGGRRGARGRRAPPRPGAPRGAPPRRSGAAAAEGVRAARAVDGQRRAGARPARR